MRLALKITAALFFIALTWVASTLAISELGGEGETAAEQAPVQGAEGGDPNKG